MADPFSLTTGVLSVVGFVLKVVSGAMVMVDKTVTAHSGQRQAIRNLRRELDKTIKGTTSMHTVLTVMLEDPKDKTVKRMRRKCVSFKTDSLTTADLSISDQSELRNRTASVEYGAEGYPTIHRSMAQQ
jgi:hypothetical protein